MSMQLLSSPEQIQPGMWFLPGFAECSVLMPAIMQVVEVAPMRHMETRRGFVMSVAMTNCGQVGWVSDRLGYRYAAHDPETGTCWPRMPDVLKKLANGAASVAGYSDFHPDVCLINRYEPGAQMGAHQDVNEQDFSQPIVSVSLGIPARFFYLPGQQKQGKSFALDLNDGDIVVFGNEARCCYHGVRKLKPAEHPLTGVFRWNLTFRRAL